MKLFTCLSILAASFIYVLACDPLGNNKPDCTSRNLNVPVRNFWDPTHYWKCTTAGAEAESIQCPPAQGFVSDKLDCVHFREWVWTPPCLEAPTN